MRCSYHVLSSLTLRPKGQKKFGGMAEESCQNLVSDEYDSNTYVVGRSRLEGILQDYEGKGGFFGIPDDTEYYGMLLDLVNEKGEDEEVEVDLHGGVIVKGPKVVYTVAVASDNSTVYTASLHSESTKVILGPESDDEGSNSTLYAPQNPSQAFPMGSEFELVIEAYAKTEYSSKLTSYDNETMFGKAFNAPTWNHPFIAEGRNATIFNVAGMLVGEDALIVAGSDLGIGSGLGVSDSADKTDYDGFVTKLIRTTGELYGDAEETAGLPTSYRLQTGEGIDDFILGLCPGESHEIVYLAGSTMGNVKGGEGDSSGDGSTRVFLIKLNITSMSEEWGIALGAALPENAAAKAEGRACAMSPDRDVVYIAGNVYEGGTMSESNERKSKGGSDVFAAKIDANTGDVLFVRQIGSASDELLAPNGGLVVTAEHEIVIYGQTNGSVYRTRNATEPDDRFDYFMTMIHANGTVEEQAADPKEVTTVAPTASPTVPATEPPTEASSGCFGNCTEYTYEFTSIKLRLEGVGYINAEAAEALEEAMESWYEAYYSRHTGAGRLRRLQEEGIYDFQTNVSYWGGSRQDGANLITYNQTVMFESNRDDMDDDLAEALIEEPFSHDENKEDFVKHLKKSHDTFAETSGVAGTPDVPDKNRPKSAAGSVNLSVFIYLAAGIFGICICWGIFTAWNMEKKDNTEDYDEKNDPDQPEAPLEVDIA